MDLHTYLSDVETARSLAKKTGIVSVLFSQWRHGVRQVPIDKCLLIERATNGLVTRRDLRPHDWHQIWPELINSDVHNKKSICN